MRKSYLMTPGPTPVPPQVLLSQAKPIIHHRTPEYTKIFVEVLEGLQYIFKTTNDIILLSSSGTGAMESAVVNLFSAGDKVIVASNGKFGDRFIQIGKTYGLKVIKHEYEWDKVVEPTDIKKSLDRNPDVKGVFVTQSETSTGVLNDVKTIGEIVKNTDAVLIIDSITGIGAVETKTDKWNLDVVMTGSQKGLMLPPGLAAVSVSNKAWKMVEKSTLPKFYFSWEKAKKSLEKKQNPFTPAVSLIVGLRESLKMMREEGLENIIKRHTQLSNALRAGVTAIGLELFAPPEGRGNAVTAIRVPKGIDGKKIPKIMSSKYGITIAGGQERLAGKIFRLGHLGYYAKFDIIITLSALEMTLRELDYKFDLGASLKAAEEVFYKNAG